MINIKDAHAQQESIEKYQINYKYIKLRVLSRAGVKRQQETDSCIYSREDTVVSFRAY